MAKKQEKIKHYSLDRILEKKCLYNIIYGERSNGKTTAVLAHGLKKYCSSGYREQMAIIRRWDEDFKGKKGEEMFSGIVNLGWVNDYTCGQFNSVYYYSSRWYLCYIDENGERLATQEQPFAFGFSISSEEHYKSLSFPNITTILFDEFITRKYYLPMEFVAFQNLLSTIIRLRDDVTIFMCGNSINKYCPYFNEMGIKNIKNQKQGTIDIYTYGETGLSVAVEYSDMPAKQKASNKYFAFDNPHLQMITQGGWEIDVYPHLPIKYRPCDVVLVFYLVFDGETLQGNVISIDDFNFIYVHRKTTPIQEDNERLVYTFEQNVKRNYRTSMLKPYGKPDKKIYQLIKEDKMFYQDNEVGEIMRNYFNVCRKGI